MNMALAAKKALGRLALTLAALTLAGMVQAAPRNPTWQAQQVVAATDGTSRVLWTADTSNGTVAGVWRMNAQGTKIGSGPVYGPYTDNDGDWYPRQLLVAPNGTSRLLWSHQGNSGTQTTVWTLDTNGTATSYGTVYGPYSDYNGDWYPQELEVAADNTSRLLWVNTNDNDTGVETAVWKLDANGTQTSGGQVYGPFYGSNGANWEPYQLVVAPDGTSRLLWVIYGDDDSNGNYTGDILTIWRLNANGVQTGSGGVYGPYAGWGVANIDLNTTDYTLRMLWEKYGTTNNSGVYSGDVACVWSFDTNSNETTIGPAYGPYTGWSADAVAALPDGTSRVEWTKTDNKNDIVTFWSFDRNDRQSSQGPVYGPYSGWNLFGVDINRSDSSFRLLWVRDDDAATVWSVNSGGTQTSGGPVYGPYSY